MNPNESLYEIWAPSGYTWSAWVKPVLFSHAAAAMTEALPHAEVSLPPLPIADGRFALVIDLPAVASIAATSSLVSAGYRPIPLYNAVPGKRVDNSAVNVEPLIVGLMRFADDLRRASLAHTAPPAFLLDHDRRVVQPGIALGPGIFDNRSISLPTDFPSAGMLQSAGIAQVVLIQPTLAAPQADLAHTLLRWQQAGIELLQSCSNSATPPIPMTVALPGGFRGFWQRLLAMRQLKRHPLGGFGGTLPVPSAG